MPTFKGSRRLVSRRWEGVNAASIDYTVFRVHSSARVDCPFSIIAAPTVAAMPAQGYGAPQGPDDGTQWAPYELQTPTLVYQHESDDLSERAAV